MTFHDRLFPGTCAPAVPRRTLRSQRFDHPGFPRDSEVWSGRADLAFDGRRRRVLLVGDLRSPGRAVALVVYVEHRQVRHEAIGRGAVPVVFSRLEEDAISGSMTSTGPPRRCVCLGRWRLVVPDLMEERHPRQPRNVIDLDFVGKRQQREPDLTN